MKTIYARYYLMCQSLALTILFATSCTDDTPVETVDTVTCVPTCASGTLCVSGECRTICTSPLGCPSGQTCDLDLELCTDDEGTCEQGTSCSDGDACTLNDTCQDDVCVGGQIDPACVDICSENEACDDGNPCTENDWCTNEVCAGEVKTCDDSDSCTEDSCNVADGSCVNTQVSTADAEICDDTIDNNCNDLTDCQEPSCADECETPCSEATVIDDCGESTECVTWQCVAGECAVTTETGSCTPDLCHATAACDNGICVNDDEGAIEDPSDFGCQQEFIDNPCYALSCVPPPAGEGTPSCNADSEALNGMGCGDIGTCQSGHCNLAPGDECDPEISWQSCATGTCELAWDGSTRYCTSDPTTCPYREANGDITFSANGFTRCGTSAGDDKKSRTCVSGDWSTAECDEEVCAANTTCSAGDVSPTRHYECLAGNNDSRWKNQTCNNSCEFSPSGNWTTQTCGDYVCNPADGQCYSGDCNSSTECDSPAQCLEEFSNGVSQGMICAESGCQCDGVGNVLNSTCSFESTGLCLPDGSGGYNCLCEI